MNIDLSKREMMLLWMTVEREILEFDARLATMDKATHKQAWSTRCELKVLGNRLKILMDAGKDGLDDLNETIKAIGRTSVKLAPFTKPQAD